MKQASKGLSSEELRWCDAEDLREGCKAIRDALKRNDRALCRSEVESEASLGYETARECLKHLIKQGKVLTSGSKRRLRYRLAPR